MFPSICPSEFMVGGMNDPSVYAHCWGWNLSGYVCWNVFGRGIVLMVVVWVVLVFGAFFHVVENLTL